MTFEIRPAGAALQFPYYERVQPKGGMALGVLRALGLVKTKRGVKRTGELACPFEFAVVPGAEAERALDEIGGERADGTPVILGQPETAADLLKAYRTLLDRSPPEQEQVDADRWLAERRTEF